MEGGFAKGGGVAKQLVVFFAWTGMVGSMLETTELDSIELNMQLIILNCTGMTRTGRNRAALFLF